MMATMSWQETLYPHTHSGRAMEEFIMRGWARGYAVLPNAFDAEDRRILRLIRPGEWERLAKCIREELRFNLGISHTPNPAVQIMANQPLYHPYRRIMRPKKVMRVNKWRHHPH